MDFEIDEHMFFFRRRLRVIGCRLNMSACEQLIKSEFPKIDDDLYQYVEGNTDIINIFLHFVLFYT